MSGGQWEMSLLTVKDPASSYCIADRYSKETVDTSRGDHIRIQRRLQTPDGDGEDTFKFSEPVVGMTPPKYFVVNRRV